MSSPLELSTTLLAGALLGAAIASSFKFRSTSSVREGLSPKGIALLMLSAVFFLAASFLPRVGCAKLPPPVTETPTESPQISTEESARVFIPMTFTGTVQTRSGQAVFYPDPGQLLNQPTLLIMKDIPKNGTAQQRFLAAVAYFAHKAGSLSITGTLEPFAGDQVLIVATN